MSSILSTSNGPAISLTTVTWDILANTTSESVSGKVFTKAMTPEIVEKCHQNIKKNQLGWGHSVKKGVAYTAALVAPTAAITALPLWMVYHYREQLLNKAVEVLFQDLPEAVAPVAGSTALVAMGGAMANKLMLAKFGVAPLTPFVQPIVTVTTMAAQSALNLVTYAYGFVATTIVSGLANSVANSYNKQAQEAEAQIKIDHQTMVTSLTDRCKDAANLIKAKFEAAGQSLTKKYKVLQIAKNLEARLPELKASWAQFGLSSIEIMTIVKKLEKTIGRIECLLDVQLDETDEAQAHNYELLVQLPEKISVNQCIAPVVDLRVDEAKAQKLGKVHFVKGLVLSGAAGIVGGLAVPTTVMSTILLAKDFFNVDVLDQGTQLLMKSGLPAAIADNTFAIGAAGTIVTGVAVANFTTSKLYKGHMKEREDAANAVKMNLEAAQKYVNKTFNDVLEGINNSKTREEDLETLKERLPLWEQQIKLRPELNADEALQGLRDLVSEI